MAHTPGDFSPSVIGDVIIKEQNMLNGQGRTLSELKLPIVGGAAILKHQDPSITETWEGQDCIGAKVSALRACAVDVAGTATIDCTIPAGTELATESLTVTKGLLCNPVRFKIHERECNNAFTWEDRLAYGMMKSKVALEVAISKALISLASTSADIPLAAWFKKTTGTVVSNSYNVTAVNWTADTYADIVYAAGLTDIFDPIILNGSNFFHDTFLQKYKGIACCDNDGVLNGIPYQVYFDTRNVDQVLAADVSLAIDKNSLLFWSSSKYTNLAPKQTVADTSVWRDSLPRLQYMANGMLNDIFIDVRAQKQCENGEDIFWNIELVARGAMVANLQNCDNRNGILKVTQV